MLKRFVIVIGIYLSGQSVCGEECLRSIENTPLVFKKMEEVTMGGKGGGVVGQWNSVPNCNTETQPRPSQQL